MSDWPPLDPRIERLKSTTFYGKRLTRRQIAEVQETVGCLPQLSRHELAHTLCEHLRWQTPRGSNRIQLALRLLEELERLGILALPTKRHAGRGPNKPVPTGVRSDPGPVIDGPLAELRPLRLEPVTGAEEVAEWNEWVQRHHPLGYRRPVGVHLRYFLRDRQGRLLGCLLFDFAARELACRDAWIGWQGEAHRSQLHLVVRNARFLLFDWVRVKNLASHALGLALRQLPADWQRQHGYRPVLAETYLDPQQHAGSCYKAANWRYLGLTQGSRAKAGRPAQPPKAVYACPLRPDWRQVLLGGPAAVARPRPPQPGTPPEAAPEAGAEDRFTQLWQEILAAVVRVANEHDRHWVRRRRVLNTLLVVLFVFRLVFAPDRQGYAVTLAELWQQCRRLGVALPQPAPVSAASMCAARAKVRDAVFRQIHRAILARAPRDDPRLLWRGHRTFAVDGSKLLFSGLIRWNPAVLARIIP